MKKHSELTSQLRLEYEQKQRKIKYIAEHNKKLFYDKYPYIKHLDDSINNLYLKIMKITINDENINETKAKLELEIETIKQEKDKYIKLNHVDTALLYPKYECNICHDTGIITQDAVSRPCSCYTKRYNALVYENSGLKNLTDTQNFDNFDLKIFSDEPINDTTPRKSMQKLKEIGEDFADNFDDDQHKSMLFIGKTGLGKTYLALSIAQRLIEKNKSVVYETSLQLFEKLARTVFNKTEQITDRGFYDLVYEADLLIIDDLGTEIVNDYVNSQLFNIVNTRILANKKIIISTNLTAVEINDRYERRITSRLFDRNDFVHYKFIGTDLRWRK